MNALNIDNLQNLSKQQVEAMTAFASTVTKGMQELATETADFSKHSMTTGAETVQKLFGAKSIETAIQIQTEYAKSSYEDFVAHSSKFNELVGRIAADAFKPLRDAASAAVTKA